MAWKLLLRKPITTHIYMKQKIKVKIEITSIPRFNEKFSLDSHIVVEVESTLGRLFRTLESQARHLEKLYPLSKPVKNTPSCERGCCETIEQSLSVPSPALDTRTIHIPKGLTIEAALAKCKALFPVWRWTDKNFDEIVTSDRTSKKAYSIKFKNVVEADGDMKNLSANDLKAKGIKSITLLERLVFELTYFKKTGKHLDLENWTLCAGSRGSGGGVPYVCWSGGLLRVSWADVEFANPCMRARVAVI